MSQFKFVNDLNQLGTIDGPLTKGPIPRYQRKALETSSSTNVSMNSTKNDSSTVKTPKKSSLDGSKSKKTPSNKTPKGKTPKKTPTPGKSNNGDRFIPARSAMNFELGHFKLNQKDDENGSPTQKQIEKVMSENLHGGDINAQRILSYTKKAPSAPDGFVNPMRVIYSQVKTPASAKNNARFIPSAPERILDAPDIIDDYYLNILDWSTSNILAAALGASVYLWNAGSGKIEELIQLEGSNYVSSLAWIQEGEHLAIGTSAGTTELWDCSRLKRLRVMDGHSARVGSLSWNSYVISSGCRSGQIIHHDVRQREHKISTIAAHTQEVCGLKWSRDGKYLASGGNDNVLNIWQSVSGGHHGAPTPLHAFTAHQAAVKAVAWCPWQPHILASGGGTADRHIRLWNCNSGSCITAVDTKSQVCALLWSTNYKELISGHGYANNQLIIWKYPGMTKVTELTGHTARVLHMAMSPDGSTVLSAGADETLRLWNCFVKDPLKAKSANPVKSKPSVLKQCIR